ncbi:hypothetical protein [Blastococcus sp. KM273129]|uniref:hypothetical protein n=1 Tax=Blastococcus sp. KM273129 TaxID=2570315 RepID=UPI001F192D26|nr:hypothetical protein [Blastococcus sp. KM273129]MCF6735231.1 hypothetical protein [Blastococcus sp. KM273129]
MARLFFGLKADDQRSITLEKVGADGRLLARHSRELVYPESNRNSRIEFDFGSPKPDYPASGRPVIVVVQADHKTYRYRTLMPGDPGHQEMMGLVSTGQSVGRTMKGVRRRIVTLDDVEAAWSGARLRGSAG